jgi:hypothetical protein
MFIRFFVCNHREFLYYSSETTDARKTWLGYTSLLYSTKNDVMLFRSSPIFTDSIPETSKCGFSAIRKACFGGKKFLNYGMFRKVSRQDFDYRKQKREKARSPLQDAMSFPILDHLDTPECFLRCFYKRGKQLYVAEAIYYINCNRNHPICISNK